MEHLRLNINRALFMGLFDFECHYSHYAPGDFYKRHVDAFKGESNRVLSTVLYLNPDWQSEDAGELVMYAPNSSNTISTVSPVFNRYSIADWFRINGNVFGNLEPPR